MGAVIRRQRWFHFAFYALFGLISFVLLLYYLSNTLFHYTTNQQFPINSFHRFPLTWIIFPAELFSICFALYFVYTLFSDRYREPTPAKLLEKEKTRIAVILPVYNEPKDVVDRTIIACKNMRWPGGMNIYLCDDSTNEDSKREMDELAKKHHCEIVRRTDRTGYKAGNINNAIRHAVKEEYFAIFDADQAPEPEFLEDIMDYFSSPLVAFVQTPQHYIGESTLLERGAKIGSNIFFQSMCVSRSNDGATVFCGTNAVFRKKSFLEVNGYAYYTATEDIELGLRLNDAGYRGVYLPKILVHGYAPPDLKAYMSQQYRWANGNLAILRQDWLKIFGGPFALKHKIHTFFALAWWFIGIITLLYIIVPILSLVIGGGTHHTWLPGILLVMLYFNVVMGIGMIYVALHGRNDLDDMRFSDAVLQYILVTNSAFIYARAAVNAMLKRYVGFVTTKKTRSASSIGLIKWNLFLSAICFGFSMYALYHAMLASDLQGARTYLPISLWLLFYSIILACSILFVDDAPKSVAVSA